MRTDQKTETYQDEKRLLRSIGHLKISRYCRNKKGVPQNGG